MELVISEQGMNVVFHLSETGNVYMLIVMNAWDDIKAGQAKLSSDDCRWG